MATQILTTDFTENELKNCKTYILENAKRTCSDKYIFHRDEINNGHCSQYHLDMMDLYHNEFIKWVPIVLSAKKRDAENESYWGVCLQG